MTIPIPAIPGQSASQRAEAASPTDPRIKQKAREFEAVLLGQFVQLMFKGLDNGGPLGGGSAEGQWRDVLAEEYGKALADRGGIDLATQIAGEISEAVANQGIGQPPDPAIRAKR